MTIEEVGRVATAWQAAVNARDARGAIALVTDDVIVIHQDGHTTVGRAALELELRALFQRFLVDEQAAVDETVVAGDWAYELSHVSTALTPTAGGQTLRLESRVLKILRRTPEGHWRIARMMAVEDRSDAA